MHKLLARQLRRKAAIGNEAQWKQALTELAALAGEPWLPPQAAQVLGALPELFGEVDSTYRQFDRDLELRRRSLEVSSAELMHLNHQLREAAASRQRALDSLRDAANRLLCGAGLSALNDDETSLESLSSLMATLAQEREAAQQKLSESEARFRALTELSSDWYWEQDDQFRFTGTQGESDARAGITADAHVQRARWELPHTYPMGFTWEAHRAALARHEPFRDLVLRREPPDAEARYVSVSGAPIFDAQGGFVGYRGVAKDVTERVRSEEALRQSQMAAQEATRAKSQFLANMSHEIRTPMNGVLGMTELLLGTQLTSKQRQFAETARRSGEALLALINDILDFSKIEAGKMVIDSVAFSLRDLLEDVTQLLAEGAASKGLELVCRVHPDVPAVINGDPMRVRQVLINLIGNAIKFTEHGEVVTEVRVANAAALGDAGALEFEVRDTGIGIAPKAQKNLFVAFSQADGSTTRHYGGTGLGLAICRQLVELMGGRMSLESAPGHGSTFRFTLPCEIAASPAQPSGLPSHALWLASKRLLIVGDKAAWRDTVCEMAQREFGVRCVAVASGIEAIQLAREAEERDESFDVALLDADMPVLGGIALAAAFRTEAALSNMGLLLASSVIRTGEADRARSIGFAATLTKPLRQADLLHGLLLAFERDPGAVSQKLQTAAARRAHSALTFAGSVLVVEDNPTNQQVLRAVLENFGLAVHIAHNGREAVNVVQQSVFDLLLMDCQMPVLDGYMATRAIRALESESAAARRRTPIVALTAHATQADRERCMNAGMDGYLSKPFTQATLRRELERWLSVTDAPKAVPPPAELAARTQRLNLQTWRELRMLDRHNANGDGVATGSTGNNGMLASMVGTYVNHTQLLLTHLKVALERGDTPAIAREAHALKSGSVTIGAARVGKLADALEQVSQAGDLSRCRSLMTEILSEFEQAQSLLSAELQASSKAA